MAGTAADIKGPLNGVTVVDLTTALSGPYCTWLLSELGAKVIKVERPGTGDGNRRVGPFYNGKSMYFQSVNRNKRFIALNLKDSQEDRAIFERLLETADVLMENYRAGVLDRLGYPWEVLHQRFPQLIYGAISGFGHTGPYKKRPAYDMVVQAMGGLMSITGHPGGPPTRAGSSIGDIFPAVFMSSAINAALFDRSKNGGKGTKIDISMLDAQVAILENAVARVGCTGESPGPIGSRHPSVTPFQAYKTKDGHVVIADNRAANWPTLCRILGNPGLSSDPRFANHRERIQHVDELEVEIEKCLTKHPSAHWLKLFAENDVAHAPVNKVAEMMKDPQVRARGMLVPTDDPECDNLELTAAPFNFSRYPKSDIGARRPMQPVDGDRAEVLASIRSKL